jgi:hypothetical protein
MRAMSSAALEEIAVPSVRSAVLELRRTVS